MAGSDEELARTATAPGSGPAVPAPELGATLGRYRLESKLGEGGMGVVHAAFDPDLERRVALKVLRASDGDEANKRLLREARAMARLTHANVVTVHEVGSANGRDYVAMELVEGSTLADWLRSEKRDPEEIVAAFVAAGRGLAAAHAAGLVHRDFKPHNVLRRADGRICVTDFGLARGVDATPSGLEATMRMPASTDNTPSPLSGLTATGSVLGTPAYMAPEQWSGGTIGPAADQFGFCVALWEALTGERPFRGTTIDDLKREVARGPAELDVSKLPRRLRRALRRGLDPDPAKRWPSMDALLAAIARGERRPTIALALVAGAALVAIGLYVALAGSHDGCAPPQLDVASVWSPARAAALAKADQAPGAELIAADFSRWQAARAGACKGAPAARTAKLVCLDGVLAQLDATARALSEVHGAAHADAGDTLVDPAVCELPRPPRLVAAYSDKRRAALVAELEDTVRVGRLDADKANALVTATEGDPCAQALARIVASHARRSPSDGTHDVEEADSAAQRCGDDWLIAESAFAVAEDAFDTRAADLAPKVERADAALAAVPQPDLRAALDELRMEIAQHNDHLDEAISRLQAARDAYASRGRTRLDLRARVQIESLLHLRGHPEDLAATAQHYAAWRDEAVKKLGATDPVVRELESAAADWQFASGDVAGAHPKLLAAARLLPLDESTRASGRVVDEHGAPVAGATVYAGSSITSDAVGILPQSDQRETTTRADGTFELREAASDAVLVAGLGDRRSQPVKIGEGVTLALEPTSRVEGKVDVVGEPRQNVTIVVRDPSRQLGQYAVIAPVQPDGTFVLAGVLHGNMIVHAIARRLRTEKATGTPVKVDRAVVTGVQLSVSRSKRVVHVIVRNTVGVPLTHAAVIVLPGIVPSQSAAALNKVVQEFQQLAANPIEREHAPAAVIQRAKPGDVYATVPEVPEGAASACAIAVPPNINDPEVAKKFQTNLDKIEVRCLPIGEHDEAVVIEVPPVPRLD